MLAMEFVAGSVPAREQEAMINKILYMAKLSSGKTFAVFADFQLIAKVFPLNYVLAVYST